MPGPNRDRDKDSDVMDTFRRLVSQDTDGLREWIDQVSQEIESREQLKHKLISKVRNGVENARSLVDEIQHWEPGYKPSVNGRRTNLEKECLALRREERLQELNAWRDVSVLKRQLRELLKEYKEAIRRKDMLDYEV